MCMTWKVLWERYFCVISLCAAAGVGQQRAGEGQEAPKGFRRLTRGLSRRASRDAAGAGAPSPLVCSWRGLPKAPPGEAACLARKILIILVILIFLGLFFIMVKCSCQLRARQTPAASPFNKARLEASDSSGGFPWGLWGFGFFPLHLSGWITGSYLCPNQSRSREKSSPYPWAAFMGVCCPPPSTSCPGAPKTKPPRAEWSSGDAGRAHGGWFCLAGCLLPLIRSAQRTETPAEMLRCLLGVGAPNPKKRGKEPEKGAQQRGGFLWGRSSHPTHGTRGPAARCCPKHQNLPKKPPPTLDS